MSAASSLAAALASYVDAEGEFWWVARAESDPRCAEVLATLRDVVEEFKDGEPVDDLPWQETLTSALLLFRRYEQGAAEAGTPLEWEQRVLRLRDVYDHYAAELRPAPALLWTRLFRYALFVPHSAPYRAVSAMLAGDTDVERLAEEHGVDAALLRQAGPGVAAGV